MQLWKQFNFAFTAFLSIDVALAALCFDPTACQNMSLDWPDVNFILTLYS